MSFQACRGLLLPWIFVNGVTFVIFCITLLVPLAILWFFLVKNMMEIYREGREAVVPTRCHFLHLIMPKSRIGTVTYTCGL